ncbi:30S ribosomal protein S1 [Halomicronema hongdechloris C2206]|uniref:30S ribosomal protein S1 n=1 Tax=Halomicronema hongdechloris C2206 TaxID=1641165 RepID=A0A1Z3HTY7_9CYAN|nr:S1 RNA-binding domain-containing protein [Halomicronema hongdechloris]ASC73788.1 30S ribosomal protein S1 [Halomicronema hongdechloris C2206]
MTFSAEDFAKALEQHDYHFQTGSVVQGMVIAMDSDGAYVDIGGKAAAFLPLREASLKRLSHLEDVLTAGDSYDFLVIRDQDADGQVLLSLRQLQLQALWEKLATWQADNATLEVKVTGTNKGGVLADVEGLRAFIPRSHLLAADDLEALVGQTLRVSLLEVSPERNKLVLSQRQAARSQAMATLEIGQLVEGTITGLKPFGAFVEFDGVTGLLHINQISKSYVDSIAHLFQIGQSIKTVIVDLDDVRQRISLSTKVLEKYPGEMLKDMPTVMATAEDRHQNVAELLAEREA